MSLTSLARDAVQSSKVKEQNQTQRLMKTAIGLAPEFSIREGDLRGLIARAEEKIGPPAAETGPPPNISEMLVQYIPTESATLYVAATSGAVAIQETAPFFTTIVAYWFFAFLTPIILFLLFVKGRRSNNQSAVPRLRELPWFKMIASFIAFLAWGLAVPTNPYATSPLRGACFAFFALFISIILSLIGGAVGEVSATSSST